MKSVGLQIALLVALQFGLVFSLTRCASDGEQGEVQEAVEQEQGQSASAEGAEQASAESSEEQQAASEASSEGEGSSGLAAVESSETSEQPVGAEVEVEEQTEQEATSGAQDAVAESLVQAVESETAPMDTSVGQAVPESSYTAPEAAPVAARESTFASTASTDGDSGHLYIVQKGDSLSLIAKRIYGSFGKWRELAEFNGIRNPNRIFPGDSVRFPDNAETAGFSSQYQNLARETIQVKQGDTLASIASDVYRDSGAWKALWRQNGSIDNPNRILVGQKLTFIPLDTLYQFMGTDGARATASAPRRAPRTSAKKAAKAAPVAEVKQPVQEAAPAAPPVEPVAAAAPSAPEPPAIPEPKEEPKTAAAPAESNTKPVLEETTDEADEMMKPNDNLEEVIDSDETE